MVVKEYWCHHSKMLQPAVVFHFKAAAIWSYVILLVLAIDKINKIHSYMIVVN